MVVDLTTSSECIELSKSCTYLFGGLPSVTRVCRCIQPHGLRSRVHFVISSDAAGYSEFETQVLTGRSRRSRRSSGYLERLRVERLWHTVQCKTIDCFYPCQYSLPPYELSGTYNSIYLEKSRALPISHITSDNMQPITLRAYCTLYAKDLQIF